MKRPQLRKMIDESFDKLRMYGLRSAQEIKQDIEQNLTKIILTRKGLELCSLDASRNAFFDKESKYAEMRSKCGGLELARLNLQEI